MKSRFHTLAFATSSLRVIFLKDPACPFRIHGMSIVARWVKAAFGRPAVVLGLLLGAFAAVQCCLPLATAVKIGADEDYELSKAVLCLNGHRLYTEVWSDQPPLYVSLLTVILKHFSPAVLGSRLLTTASTLLLLGSLFLLVLKTNGRLAAALVWRVWMWGGDRDGLNRGNGRFNGGLFRRMWQFGRVVRRAARPDGPLCRKPLRTAVAVRDSAAEGAAWECVELA